VVRSLLSVSDSSVNRPTKHTVRSLLSVYDSSVNRPTKHTVRSLLSVYDSSVNRPTKYLSGGARGHRLVGEGKHEPHH
jgi:hypothetical protein